MFHLFKKIIFYELEEIIPNRMYIFILRTFSTFAPSVF